MFSSVSFDETRGPIGSSVNSSQLKISNEEILSIADNDIIRDISQERIITEQDDTTTTAKWQVVKTLGELDSVLRDSKPSLNAPNGGFALPCWMFHLDVSERSFSVILHHRSVESNVSSDPLDFEWDGAARKLAVEDLAIFTRKHGDSFVSGFSEQRTISVVFNVVLSKVGDLVPVSNAVGDSLAIIQSAKTTPKDQIERGCRYLQDLHSRNGVHIT